MKISIEHREIQLASSIRQIRTDTKKRKLMKIPNSKSQITNKSQ